jgi:acetyl esterase/lipase
MDVYYPDSANGPSPVVVFVHGGGWRGGDKGAVLRHDALPELRQRGYLVASVNYRLVPEFRFPTMIEDTKCAVRHLRANAATYGLDPSRIGAWGTSAGGHLVALMGVTDGSEGFEGDGGYAEQSSRVQAVVDMYGATELPLMFDRPRAPLLEAVFGADGPEDEALINASPTSWISADDPPVLMAHGDMDTTVPLAQSEIFLEKLHEAGVIAELVVVENGGHGFNPIGGPITPTFFEIGQIVADFFDEQLR